MGEITTQQILLLAVGMGGAILAAILVYLFAAVRRHSLIARAKREYEQTVSDAEREAATILKEAKTAVKEQEFDLRARLEREARDQRKELVAIEKRILAKEESVDKRVEALESKYTDLATKERELASRENALQEDKNELVKMINEQMNRLEAIAGMSAEDARKAIYERLEAEVKRDTAIRLKRIEDEMTEKADKKARWVISQAIQRCAADHVAETTVSVVPLPNDEMKGRIIGREGRNIRALENATGINIIIDDTPEAVILSGFDPVRREVARISLERLLSDGRIHPARIEEIVEKVTEEMNQNIRETGEQVCLDVDVHGLHPEVIRLLGRLKYRTSYGQNVLQHSIEVSHLAGIMAAELGLDVKEAKRAGLIHDIGKAVTHEVEGSHAAIGHDYARKYGENEIICNAIGAHHNDMEQSSVIAVLVQAADALSAARPGARRETVETYIKRLEQLEHIADEFSGVDKAYAIQAGREIRVVVTPEKVSDAEAAQLARDVATRVEAEVTYPGQIKVTVVRETRAVATAK